MRRRLRSSTLFPYTTLFRSKSFVSAMADATRERPDPRVRESIRGRSEEHTSELQSRGQLVCRLLLEKKKKLFYHICASVRGLADGCREFNSLVTGCDCSLYE